MNVNVITLTVTCVAIQHLRSFLFYDGVYKNASKIERMYWEPNMILGSVFVR